MKTVFNNIAVALSLFVCTHSAVALTNLGENEPNGSAIVANPIVTITGYADVFSHLSPSNDVDVFSFTAPAGSRAWIYTDTGGTTNAGASSRDTIITLLAADGITVIESDDDDGTGNGLDGTIESTRASAIAGRTLTAGGNYYIKVVGFSGAIVDPYRVFLAITQGGSPEEEPNNTPAQASLISYSTVPGSLRTGIIGTTNDLDYYSVAAKVGDTILMNADCDPERNSTNANLVVELYATNGTTLLLTIDLAGLGTSNNPPAEAAAFTVTNAGTYFVKVRGSTANSTNTYDLYVAVQPVGSFSMGLNVLTRSESLGNTALVTVNRVNGNAGSASVSYATTPGTATHLLDYTNTSGSLSFGHGVTNQTISILINNDSVLETNETLLVTLTNATAGATILALNPVTVVILDDDQPTNDSPATATTLDLSSGSAMGGNTISPGGDVDYYAFTATAGTRAWIATDTGGAQNPGAASRDTVITLFNTNGTTVVEEDDDDGSGNGLDGTVETGQASVIGGRTLTNSGTYYIRVKAFSGTAIVDPYRLQVQLTTSPATPEAEPNNTSAQANVIVSGGAVLGLRSGAVEVPNDADYYAVTAQAGDIIQFNADCDPDRDGAGADLVLDLYGPDGTNLLLAIDSSLDGSLANPAAEAGEFLVINPGTYYVKVRHFSALETGAYHLMVAVNRYALRINSIAKIGGNAELKFSTLIGKFYQVERTPNLNTPIPWAVQPALVNGSGGTVTHNVPGTTSNSFFYRVREVP